MTARVKSTFRRPFEWLRERAARIGSVRPRFDILSAAKVARGGIADLLFPPSCASCGAELEESTVAGRGSRLCDTCLDEMEIFSEPMCVRCGAPLPGAIANENRVSTKRKAQLGCYRCRGRKLWFDETVALG